MMEKATVLDADEIFFDLEDAVVEQKKDEAREQLISFLTSIDLSPKLVAVRVNDITTDRGYDDIVEIVLRVGQKINSIILPKVRNPGDVQFVDRLLTLLETKANMSHTIALEILIETAEALYHLDGLGEASKRTENFIFGVGDYALSLGIPQFEHGVLNKDFPDQWVWAMSYIANSAWAVGIEAIDGPCVDFHRREVFEEAAKRARCLGFRGKWCIHPNQVAWANEVFQPHLEEVIKAKQVLDTYAAAASTGRGAIALDGKLIDEATRKMAEYLLDYAEN
jgi:citrate lyase beta subunit